MFFSRGLIGANSKGESAVEVSSSSLLLNGSSEGLDCGNDSSLAFTNNFSISAFIYPTSLSSTNTIYSRWGGAGDKAIAIQQLTGGQIAVTWSTDGTATAAYTTTLTVSINTWTHLIVTLTGGTLTIRVNDTTEETDSLASINAGSGNTTIGEVLSGSYFQGSINLVCAFDTNLTSTEVTRLYNGGTPKQPWLLDAGLQSKMALGLPLNDQTNSNEFNDYSGNANNASLTGSPTVTGQSQTIINSTDPEP